MKGIRSSVLAFVVLLWCGTAWGQDPAGMGQPLFRPFAALSALPFWGGGAPIPAPAFPPVLANLGVYGPDFYGGYVDATAKLSSLKPPSAQEVPLAKNIYRNRGALVAGTGFIPLDPAVSLAFRGSYVIPLPFHRMDTRLKGFDETFDGNVQWWTVSGEIAYALGPVLRAVGGVRYESYDSRRRTRITVSTTDPLPAGHNYLILSAVIPYLGFSGGLSGPTGSVSFDVIGSPVALGGMKFRDAMRNIQTHTVNEVTSSGRLRNSIFVEAQAEATLNIMYSSLGFFLRAATFYSQPDADFSFDRVHWAGGIKLAVPFSSTFRGL